MLEMSVHGVHTENVLSLLALRYSSVMRRVWRHGDRVVACFVHDEYVFRTNSHQTLTTVIEADRDCCRITIVGSGGGSGILNLSWGSQSAGERTIQRDILRLTTTSETQPRTCGLELQF